MKNNHTQLKRLAAISLVLVMCLSALPMLAPSASAAPAAGEGRGYICITFDDGKASDYEIAYPVLSAANIPGTSFIVTDWIGKQGYMDASQIQALDAAGWEIGSHGKTHLSLGTASPEDVEAEMRDSKLALEALGVTVESFAYPHGSQSAATRDIAEQYYVRQRGIQNAYPQYLTCLHDSIRMVLASNPRSFDDFKSIVDGAIASDSVAVVYWHGLLADGTLEDSLSGVPYTIQDVAAYITAMRDAYGLQPIQFRDLDSIGSGNVVEWTASADGLASEGGNWDTGTAPTNGDYLIFTHNSPANCTLDVSASYKGIYLSIDYPGTVTVAPGVELSLGNGGFQMFNGAFVGDPDGWVTCGGHWQRHTLGTISSLNLHMTLDGAWLHPGGLLKSIRLSGDTNLRGDVDVSDLLRIDDGVHVTTMADRGPVVRYYKDCQYVNNGTIDGAGCVLIRLYDKDMDINLGDVRCNVQVRLITGALTKSSTLTLAEDTVIGGGLNIISEHDTYTATLDTGGHELHVGSLTIGQGGAVRGGNGTIYTATWTSTVGTWLPEQSTVVLADGGTVKLASGQSFNRLEVASEDGRTASWTMTATGTVSPIVTGLKSGSYLWYLDGVEQGEIEADKDGTIALSYESTGPHTIEVKPSSMTAAMDGVYQAVGIVAVLAVLGGLVTMVGRIKF